MKPIDVNCDMGESFGTYTLGMDEAVMPLITSAIIACDFHAGDPSRNPAGKPGKGKVF